MLDFSPEKMIFIFLIVLIVLGPEKLPEVSRKIGKAMGELRRLSGGFREEMNKTMNEMNADPPSSGRPSGDQSSSDRSSNDRSSNDKSGVPGGEIPPETSDTGSGDGSSDA